MFFSTSLCISVFFILHSFQVFSSLSPSLLPPLPPLIFKAQKCFKCQSRHRRPCLLLLLLLLLLVHCCCSGGSRNNTSTFIPCVRFFFRSWVDVTPDRRDRSIIYKRPYMWGKDRRRRRKFKGEIASLSARRRRKTFFFLGRECLLWKNLIFLSAKPQTESSFSSFPEGEIQVDFANTHTIISLLFPFWQTVIWHIYCFNFRRERGRKKQHTISRINPRSFYFTWK